MSSEERLSTADDVTPLQANGMAKGSSVTQCSEALSSLLLDENHEEVKSKLSSKPKKKRKKKKANEPPQTSPVSNPHTMTNGGKLSATATATSKPQSNLETELEWCITQLQMGLLRSEATKSRKQENEKYIRTLKSDKTPLPRKRQLMKNLFGDYRARMMKEPPPRYPGTTSSDTLPNISRVKNTSCQGSRFIKRSAKNDTAGAKGGEHLLEDGDAAKVNAFCFNFEIES